MTTHMDEGGANESTTSGYFVENPEIVAYTEQLQPFIDFVKGLLHRGTILIICLGMICNTLSFVVLTRKNMRKVTPNLYLAVLAVCDTLALILNFMVGVLRGQNVWINKSFQDSEHVCKLHSVIVELFNLLSVWIIVAFTAERFVMIRFPLKARNIISRRNTTIVITCVIVFTLGFSFHKIFVSGFEGDSVFGYAACRTSRAILPGIIYFYVAFNTWFPTAVIATLNFLIIQKVRSTSAKRQEMTGASSRSKSDEKVLKILLTVSSTYVFLMLPLGIVQTVELSWNTIAKVPQSDPYYVKYMTTKITLKWIRAFFFFFYQINFAVNFFLYAFSTAGTKFRATLRRVFGMKGGPISDTTIVDEAKDEGNATNATNVQTVQVTEKEGDKANGDVKDPAATTSNDGEKKVVIDESKNETHA